MTLHPQLQAIVEELEQALARLHALAAHVPEAAWARRPDPARWSIGECVAHLNLTSAAYLPLIKAALGSAPAWPVGDARPHHRRDPMGWLMWWMMGPPVLMRVKTAARFVPQGVAPARALVAEFERWQRDLIACVHEAEGRDLSGPRIRSPFDPRISYNVYSALTILPRHQHRHLWQAEQVRARLGSGP
jgi:DinB superfamily